MFIVMLFIFIAGYAAIAFEHKIKIDKAASALFIGTLIWTVFVLGDSSILNVDTSKSIKELLESGQTYLKSLREFFIHHFEAPVEDTPALLNHYIIDEMKHHFVDISEILFFLLGAMTIVELIDSHDGFTLVTNRITTTNRLRLLIIISTMTFFFSSVLDNLTTAIVMSALLKKLLKDNKDIWLFAGMVIIAANAGGAWTPIGDVTTIMLWIGGQVTAVETMYHLAIPSLLCVIVPMVYLGFKLKGDVEKPDPSDFTAHILSPTTTLEKRIVFSTGVLILLLVPVFKAVTHLPPFVGILFGLGIIWIETEIMHRNKPHEERRRLSVFGVLRKIDVSSVLFFLGILLAVAGLNSAGHLGMLAAYLESTVGDIYLVNVVIGLISSVIDNVPLVAGAMGMYEIGPEIAGISYPQDHAFWQLLAYCAGTGGSCLIIGSAAGVAVMGILKIDFIWYLKRISLLALSGYLAGVLAYYLFHI